VGGRANPVVTRLYRESSEADSCVQAIRLLLDFTEFTEEKQMATATGGPDDTEDMENDRTDTKFIPE
jgi:hypothetical protein